MRISVKGILVDLWRYETGSESLVLAQVGGTETVRVMSSEGTRPQPSEYADIGDELLVLGDLSRSGAVNTVYASSDCVSVSKESEDLLTLELLRDSWVLFDGDSVRIRCMVDYDSPGVNPRLFSLDMNTSMAVVMDGFDPGKFIGSRVVVTGTVSLDSCTLSLVMVVSSVVLDV